MKKKGLLAALMLSSTMILGACGNNNAEADGTVGIEFMHSFVEQERLSVIDELIERFEDENPGITVTQVPVDEDDYNTTIVTRARAGQLPEVIEIGQEFVRVMARDELIDSDAVTSVMQDVGEANFFEGARRILRTEDGNGYYAVPISGWVQGIWYNKEMLAEKGFSEPSTWEEILEIAETFANADTDERTYGIGIPTGETAMSEQVFSMFALSNNANVLNEEGELTLNTPEMKEALTFYQELAKHTMPGSIGATEIRDAFLNGTVPMAVFSTFIINPAYQAGMIDNLGFATVEQESVAVSGTATGLAISAGLEDAEKEAAQKFIAFMAEAENSAEFVLMSPGGAVPPNRLVAEGNQYLSNEVISALGDLATEITNSYDDIQVFGVVGDKNILAMGDITSSGLIGTMVNRVTVRNEDVSTVLESTTEQLESLLGND